MTEAIITIRIIKNFEYRTVKNLVLQNIKLDIMTIGELKKIIIEKINVTPAFKLFRNVDYDTLKIYMKAHRSKTQNLIINLDNDEWILNDENASLSSCNIENETELSFFNREAYEAYKSHPDVMKWE
ncbi:eukaryotic protein [Gigaspora margarita]|uniref:Eukaryotic protein n=1 Tax=Gigaspora margarita TaxID=4874 RepID=A0A8H4A0I4_GIGMA|nr:eukaryotic protein [Gigaspora margarita]